MTEEVVVVGAGHAGMQLSAALRGFGFDGAITVVHRESGWPYQRPPLSKSYLRGDLELGRFPLSSSEKFATNGIRLQRGTVVDIDRARQLVKLDDGDSIRYDRLVLALGSRNRQLAVPGHELAGVLSLRTLVDAQALRQRLSEAHDVVVIGGGYIGLEVAANLGRPVTVLEARERLLVRTSSPEIERFVAGLHSSHGVAVRTGASVTGLHGDGGQISSVSLAGGEELPADLVLVAVGIVPNCELAERAGLSVDDGVLVDEYLTTEDPRVMAIGDCARFPHWISQNRVRLESVHNANGHARAVAAALTGRSAAYTATPASWSQQFDARIQIAGLPSPNHSRVVCGQPDTAPFSVLSFDADVLAAVESVNSPSDHLAAVRLLDGPRRPTREQLRHVSFSVTALVRSMGSEAVGHDVRSDIHAAPAT